MAEVSTLGTSLPVESVEALAASIADSDHVPPRYIRPEAEAEAEADSVAHNDVGECQLPVIDYAKLTDRRSSQEESAKLHHACADWGFFQLINHGVADGLMEKVKSVIVEFFELPVEEKKGFAQVGNSLQGYGQSFVVSEDQKLDWGDMFYLVARLLCSRDLSFWPTHPSSFRETLSAYSLEVRRIASTLLQLMAKNLEIAPDDFSDIFQVSLKDRG